MNSNLNKTQSKLNIKYLLMKILILKKNRLQEKTTLLYNSLLY